MSLINYSLGKSTLDRRKHDVLNVLPFCLIIMSFTWLLKIQWFSAGDITYRMEYWF